MVTYTPACDGCGSSEGMHPFGTVCDGCKARVFFLPRMVAHASTRAQVELLTVATFTGYRPADGLFYGAMSVGVLEGAGCTAIQRSPIGGPTAS